MDRDKCFVIMPFGEKSIPGEPARTYDFDKVYRVIIRRAIQDAGMEPIRADEQTGSHVIHSEMFRELRDRTVVLADLSLGNPNVYYELGIRHVLSPGGTVLICREGTELPFDVRLSRVVFYRYGGRDLDWESVEETIPRLSAALQTARLRKPDSPVHALLERVFPRSEETPGDAGPSRVRRRSDSGAGLSTYQKLVASFWTGCEHAVVDLLKQHGTTVFGLRCVGEMALKHGVSGSDTARIALLLTKVEQFDMACRLYERLSAQQDSPGGYRLTPEDAAYYASSLSERDSTVEGVDSGIRVVTEHLASLGTPAPSEHRFRLNNSIGGLLMWKWSLTRDPQVLGDAITRLQQARDAAIELHTAGGKYPLGRIAKLYLRLLVATRQRDGLPLRPDLDGYRDAIASLDGSQAASERDASYLRWYQAIANADAGREEAVREGVLRAIAMDAILIGRDDVQASASELADAGALEVGASQYNVLRRFIEDNLTYLNNHQLMGLISQSLQYASLRPRGQALT
jgi:hypothetical protein